MDQKNIGLFIAEMRKSQNLTQRDLGDMLHISDKTVSKWESGRGLPEVSLMMPLCNILGISVNELLSGAKLEEEKYKKKAEENILNLMNERQENKRKILIAVAVALLSLTTSIVLCMTAEYLATELWQKILLGVIGAADLICGIIIAVALEIRAGSYECQKCGHRYVPTFKAVNLAMHAGRTRYMKCPECNKKSWQKKVLSLKKDD
jgi:transcriptional regulator with XRE-family HTH domain/DNA-directed RNA polymerase subunit RPC12/RpoP